MTCRQIEPALDRLVDGELSRWTTWRVRRHMSRCARCRAAFEETRRISAMARGWRSASPPPALQSRIAAALAAVPPVAAPPARPDQRPLPDLRRWKESPLMKHSFALTLAALAVLAALLLSGRASDPAYAELLRIQSAYRAINTVHAVGWKLDFAGHRQYMDLWFARPNLSWQQRGNELWVDDGTWSWRYVTGDPIATRLPEAHHDAESWQQLFDVERQLERIRRGFALQDLGTETLNGQSLRKLLLSGDGYNEREIWWLDPATNLVRRSVLERADDLGGQHWTVFAECAWVDYDQAPPHGLFIFHLPAGVRVRVSTPGKRIYFDQLLWDGRVLARQPGAGTAVELLAFRRSSRGDIFVLARSAPYLPLNLALSDSAGTPYVSHLVDGGYQQHPIGTVAFFPERPAAPVAGTTYQLRAYLGMNDGSPVPASEPLLAVFGHLTPQAGTITLDETVREFIESQEGAAPFEFTRSLALGQAALRENRLAAAQAYLEDAAKRWSNPNDTNVHDDYLALAEVYARQGRRTAAHTLLETAHHAATYDLKNGRTVLKAAEAMARLGDGVTARRWSEELLRWRGFGLGSSYMLRAARLYTHLGGDPAVAEAALERTLRAGSVLGFGDGWILGQAFEEMGRRDLALEAYTKGLETSGALRRFRPSSGHAPDEETDRLVRAVRRLGGDAAVNGLTDRSGAR